MVKEWNWQNGKIPLSSPFCKRLCRNEGNCRKCHAELVSASLPAAGR